MRTRSVAASLLACLALLARPAAADAPAPPTPNAPIQERSGGGNEETSAGAKLQPIYAALHGVGARLGRMNAYDWRDPERRPTVHAFDAAMAQARRNGITPVVLLEYYGSYQRLNPPQPIGSYKDWFAVGAAYAAYLQPNGAWAQAHGVRDWGVTVFSAINEPDVQASIPPQAYHDALAGLADGVHSVDPALRVIPGGFATCNSAQDPTLRGYGPAIADLLNGGALDGLDLHTYYHARWFPIEQGRRFSAQACFDRVKSASGIKRDVNFYATEFNVARTSVPTGDDAARLFLTGLWDNLGVTRNDGKTSATVLAFPWNLAQTGADDGGQYAMSELAAPWTPNARGKVYQTVLTLAGALRFSALSPRDRGEYVLDGPDRRLVVWQDLPGWTSHVATPWTVVAPAYARVAELWGYDGLRRRWTVGGGKPVIVSDLPGHETYMLLLRP